MPTAHASIGDDLNSLFRDFFSGDSVEFSKDYLEGDEDSVNNSDLELEVLPEDIDIEDLQRKIMEEEMVLEEASFHIRSEQSKLWRRQTERWDAEEDLVLLQQEIELTSQRLEQLKAQEKSWREQLENLTRQKSNIRARMRVAERELHQLLNKKFIRGESSSSLDSFGILPWLFSSKSVADILQERAASRASEQQKRTILAQLEYQKKQLDSQEQSAAQLYASISTLTQEAAAQKQNLAAFSEAKTRLTARLEYTEGQAEKALEEARKRKTEAAILLQNLHHALEQAKDRIDDGQVVKAPEVAIETIEKPVQKMIAPLKIPLKITAHFKDEHYKAQLKMEHLGTDFFAPQGSAVVAPLDGTVHKVATNGYGYSYLILDHGENLYTVYGHLSEMLVVEGDALVQGAIIAKTGGTPGTPGAGFMSSGPHLHFEVFQDGQFVDPMEWLEGDN